MNKFYFLFQKLTLLYFGVFCFTFFTAQNKENHHKNDSAHLQKESKSHQNSASLSFPSALESNFSTTNSVDHLKSKIEDITKRDAFSKHYTNSDGSYTARISSVPVNYQKDGKWNDIDTRITSEKTAKIFSYSNKTNLMETSFGDSSDKGVLINTKEGTVKDFLNTKMYWETKGQKLSEQTSKNVAPTVKGSQLFYNNLFGNISAEFTILTGERKLNYIIPDKEALGLIPAGADYLVFSEEVILPKGWTHEIGDKKDILLKDETGQIIYRYSKPQVLENYTGDGGVLEKDNVASFEIEKTVEGLTIKTKVKTAWLLDVKRIFPLAVDPLVTVYPDNLQFWSGTAESNNNGQNRAIVVGYTSNGVGRRGFIKFKYPAILTGTTITGVISGLYMNNYNYYTGESIIIKDSVDPTPNTTSYSDIYNGSTQSLSASSTSFNNSGYNTFNFNAAGISYIQNTLQNGFTSILVAQSGKWYNGDYVEFYGYNWDVAPYLDITYSTAPSCTTPSSPSGSNYISNVKFLGTLNPNTENKSNVYTISGYKDYTGLNPKAKQIPGGGINVFVSSGNGTSYIKAWIDWDNNGVYDETAEKVYSSAVAVSSTTFGFIVPSGRLPGMYNIRIRNYSAIGFSPCGSLSSGETEDYSFEVIADCSAKITKSSQINLCGAGTAKLTATKSTTVSGSGFKWYSSEFGGAALSSANTYTTPVLSVGTYTYYVTATISSCESVKRTPIKVVVSPIPTITFSQSTPSICGDISSLIVTSSGDKEEATIFEENFESGLGVFTSSSIINNNVYNGPDINGRTQWQSKPTNINTTTYVPSESVWFPAINSASTKFAFATSDISDYKYNTALTYSTTINTTNFLNLYLSFDAYFSYYGSTVSNAPEAFYVEVSTNGTTWVTPKTYQEDIGIGTRFDNKIIDLSAYINQPNLRLRFRYQAGWNDGVAIDNVRLYGNRPLPANFTWTATNGLILKASDCSSAVPSGGSASICIKPSLADIESKESWTVTSTATLNNGCSVSGPPIIIKNDNRIWNNVSGSTDWNATAWKPNTAVPDINKCVIIKTPVILESGNDGSAKNISIQPNGSLTIKKDKTLTVSDYIRNETTPIANNEDNFVLESDGNLIQINNTAPNSGKMTAKRAVTGLVNNPLGKKVDYVYWSSPVFGQITKGTATNAFSPGTPPNRFYSYRESNDRFYETGDPTFTPGRGYAVQAEANQGASPFTAPYNKDYLFKGTPNNGNIGFGISRSVNDANGNEHGYNLVGNPYPSNISFDELYKGNSTLIWNNAHFWTNAIYEQYQLGSSYGGNNYASYNGTGGNPATTKTGQTAYVSGIIKVGQGFLVQKKSIGPGMLNFQNSYPSGNKLRVSVKGTFFQREAIQKDRFWLTLIAPSTLVNSQLIGYIAGATNDFEQDFDTEAFDDYSDLFYSVLSDKKLVIQGKDEGFTIEDKVQLGANFFQNGIYSIALDNAEGIFVNSQNVYLKDKQEAIITNLSHGSYTFTATKGDNSGRFEILYKPETVLATETSIKEQIVVYRDANNFVINSPNLISEVEVYESSGKLVVVLKANHTKAILEATSLPNGVYILKIKTKNGDIVNRKIIK